MMNRDNALRSLKTHQFDLLVIGGGITGAGIALDATSRGLHVALIEKHDFASGTSSRSTKLVHGGLRYLKQFELRLVNEVGRERAIVHRLAPHLVHPDKMLLPLITNGNYGYWITSLGLTMYDILAGVQGSDRRRMLSKDETQALEPLLRTDVLEGGGLYAEYRTDDARLVMAVISTAVDYEAVAVNYCQALGFSNAEGAIEQVEVRDELSGQHFMVKAHCVVNAAGPWVDELRKRQETIQGKHLRLTKGVHIVVDHARFPVRQTIYFDHTDGRMLFAVPRGGVTYIGTTDTDYDGNKDEPEATAADVNYLLDAINHMFLGLGLRPDDVESTWAGLRPLIHEPGKSASEVSRKDEIFVSDRRLISIAGGKLTGYRKMAERVVDRVFEELELPVFAVRTHRIRLKNAEFNTYQDVSDFVIKLGNTYAEYFNGRTNAAYFVHNYGRAAEAILERAKLLQGSHALLRAELEFTVEHEMVQTALDFIERRTGRLNFDSAYVVQHARTIVEILTELLKWDAARAREELERIDTAVTRVNRWREAIATEWSK
jgi:glycerol-3-phosphate dehydrogenase